MRKSKTSLQKTDPVETFDADEILDGGETVDRFPFESATAIQVSNLNAAIRRNLSGFVPPDDLSVSAWAEKKRRLSSEASAEPGPWKNRRTPYLVEIMDAFSDPLVRHITFVASSQVGKTESINNIIGYIMDNDPGSILFIHPTNIDAKEFSRLRIAPMLRDTPCLKSKIRDARQRDSGNTILQKAFPGGILTLCGSNEAHALASKPIRYVLGDERDRWAVSAGTEGDPWSLAMARQKTFYNAKAVEVSTPTIAGASPIAAAYAGGTMEKWVSQCPHCGAYHEIQWEDIRYEYEEKEVNHEKVYILKSVFYVCPNCGGISSEAEMKAAPAHWQAENPDAYQQGHRSFWLNAFVSKWARWADMVLDWLKAQGNPLKMQVVYNTCFGKLWEDRGDTIGENELLDRREEYNCEVPDGVLLITAGVDTQDDRMEYELIGHGHFGETWHLEYGRIMGRPDLDSVWQALDDMVFNRILHYKDGIGIKVSMTLVDEGGHFTQEVRRRCRVRQSRRVFVCKGRYGQDVPYTSPPKEMQVLDIDKKVIGKVWQYQIGVDSGKTMLYDSLKVRRVGANYNHFPLSDQYGNDYVKGLLSERLVYDPKSIRNPWKWEKIPGHERNEPLDIMNYAMAARNILPANLDAIDRRLKAARMGKESPKPAPKPQPKRQKRRQKVRMEEW